MIFLKKKKLCMDNQVDLRCFSAVSVHLEVLLTICLCTYTYAYLCLKNVKSINQMTETME